MPCDITSSLKDSCRTVFGLKFFNSIFSSTLWTSFLITVIVILLLMVIIPVEPDMPVWRLFKFMFYVFLSSMGILFLHNGVLSVGKSEEVEGGVSQELLDKMEKPSDDPVEGGLKVEPKIISRDGLDPVFGKYGIN
jgi:hypothetical protein